MKTIENVTIYKCDFCSKELKRKHAMVKHEDLCNNNPKNHKACMFGCVHLKKQELDVFFEYPFSTHENDGYVKKVDVFYCEKLNKFMYPFSIEKKGIVEKYPDTFENQEAMPKECESIKLDLFEFL